MSAAPSGARERNILYMEIVVAILIGVLGRVLGVVGQGCTVVGSGCRRVVWNVRGTLAALHA